MKKLTRALSVMLTIATLFSLFSFVTVTSAAEEAAGGSCGSYLTWSVDTKTGVLTISGTGRMDDYTSENPAPWAAYKSTIRKIVIEDGVGSVGGFAFSGLTKLTECTFPTRASVAFISESAFRGDTELRAITLPASVAYVAPGAFDGCTGLVAEETGCAATTYIADSSATNKNFAEAAGATDDSFDIKEDGSGIIQVFCAETGVLSFISDYDGKTKVALRTMKDAAVAQKQKSATDIAIFSNGIANVGAGVFSRSNSLETVIFGNHISSIGDNAFFNCMNLSTIHLPASVRTIGENAFKMMAEDFHLTKVTTPLKKEEITIGDGNDDFCKKIVYESLPLRYSDMRGTLAEETGLEWQFSSATGTLLISPASSFGTDSNFEIPAYEEGEAPWDISSVAGGIVTIQLDRVTVIGSKAFAGLTSLERFVADSTLTKVGKSAFAGCDALTSAEYGEKNLKYLTIESGNHLFSTVLCYKDGNGNVEADTASGAIEYNDGSYGKISWEYVYKTSTLTVKQLGPVNGEFDLSYISAEDNPWSCILGCVKTVNFEGIITCIGANVMANADELEQANFSYYVTEVDTGAFTGATALTGLTFGAITINIADSAFPDSYAFEEDKVLSDGKSLKIGKNNGNLSAVVFGGEVTPDPTATPDPTGTPAPTGTPTPTSTPEPTATPTPTPTPTPAPSSNGSCGDDVKWEMSVDRKTLFIYGSGNMTDYSKEGDAPWYSLKDDIEYIEIGDIRGNVTAIGSYAFAGCTALKSVTIVRASCLKIRSNAFKNCPEKTVVIVKDDVSSLNFEKDGNNILNQAKGISEEGKTANGIKWLLNRETGLLTFTGEGVLSNGDIGWEGIADFATTIVFGEGITEIGKDFLKSNTYVTEVRMESSVLTTVGENAFYGCTSLSTVRLADSLTTLGSCAFKGCTALTDIDISGTAVKELPNGCFNSCTELETFRTSYYLETIGANAFRDCTALKTVALLGNISKINTGAFSGCTALSTLMLKKDGELTALPSQIFTGCTALSTVYFDGSETDLKNILKTADECVRNATMTKRVYLTLYIVADNDSNQELHAPLIFDGAPNSQIAITKDDKPAIAHYATPSASSWSMGEESLTENLVYLAESYQLTINRKDEAGNPIKDPVTISVKYGSSFDYGVLDLSSKIKGQIDIPGYNVVASETVESMPAENTEITITFRLGKYTITVQYFDQDGNPIDDKFAGRIFYTAVYTEACVISLADIEGYTVSAFEDHNTSGVKGQVRYNQDGNSMVLSNVTGDSTIRLLYHKPYTVTVKLYDVDGEVLKEDAEGNRLKQTSIEAVYGQTVEISAPAVKGMTPTEKMIKLENFKGTDEEMTVSFTYEINRYDVNIKFEHEEAASALDFKFPTDYSVSVPHFGSVSVDLPAVDGYEILVNGEKITEGSSYTMEEITGNTEIKVQYKLIRCKVTFRFVDADNHALGDIVKEYNWYDIYKLPENPEVETYSPATPDQSGIVDKEQLEVIVKCNAITKKLSVSLIDEADRKEVENQTVDFVVGQGVDYSLVLPDGYDCVELTTADSRFYLDKEDNHIKGTMPTEDVNLEVVVRRRTHELTVVFINGDSALVQIFVVNEGEDYTQIVVDYMTEQDIQPVTEFVGGVMGNGDNKLMVNVKNDILTPTPTVTNTPTPTPTAEPTAEPSGEPDARTEVGRTVLIIALIAILLLTAVVLGYVKFRKH